MVCEEAPGKWATLTSREAPFQCRPVLCQLTLTGPERGEDAASLLERLREAVVWRQHATGGSGKQGRRCSLGGPAARAPQRQGMLVVVLDEIDQLLARNPATLYELFKLPQVRHTEGGPLQPTLATFT